MRFSTRNPHESAMSQLDAANLITAAINDNGYQAATRFDGHGSIHIDVVGAPYALLVAQGDDLVIAIDPIIINIGGSDEW